MPEKIAESGVFQSVLAELAQLSGHGMTPEILKVLKKIDDLLGDLMDEIEG